MSEPSENFYFGIAVLVVWELIILIALKGYWCSCCSDNHRQRQYEELHYIKLEERALNSGRTSSNL